MCSRLRYHPSWFTASVRILTRWLPFRNSQAPSTSLPLRTGESGRAEKNELQQADGPQDAIYAVIDYEDAYVQPIILSALKTLVPSTRLRLLAPETSNPTEQVPEGAKFLQIRAYESIDFDHASSQPGTSLINSYVIRKALIRKHFLSSTVDHWVAKHAESPLKKHVQPSESFEVDYAEFLDDSLVEAFDLRASLERNGDGDGEPKDPKDREWWILKPSMSDRGQGIRLFSTMEELQGIFDEWEADMPSSDDEQDEDEDEDKDDDERDYITTSHLRHFVAQPYIDPPLLLPECGNRKFHIRTYVLCVGALQVYVSRSMLALFAARPYSAPWVPAPSGGGSGGGSAYLDAHLTNTCVQGERADEGSVRRFWDVPGLDRARKEDLFRQVCGVTGEVFEAAARGMMVHFQPLPFAFEVFGLDYLVDAAGVPWLLEVNAFPDFKQTGEGLRGVVAEFWEGAVRRAVGPFVGLDESDEGGDDGMVLVRDIDLGRR